MSTPTVIDLAPSDWVVGITDLRERGFVVLDLLTAVDRTDGREVVVGLVDPSSGERVRVSTQLPAQDARLRSLVGVFAGAAWHERETAEMFGIDFEGHPDLRPLLLHGEVSAPPLLKATPLPARIATAWPAAVAEDAGRRARRRQLPPGVRVEWVEETP